MQARLGGRFERAESRIYIFLARAGQSCYAAMLDFGRHGAYGFQVAGRGDGEARFDDVHAELFDLVRKPQLLFAVHGEAGRLFAVPQRGIEDVDPVHM